MATPAAANAATSPAPAPALVPETEYDVGLNRDGEKVKDPSYYRLLGVLAAASEAELKKAYRKQSLRWHPGSLHLPYSYADFKADSNCVQTRMSATRMRRPNSRRSARPTRAFLTVRDPVSEPRLEIVADSRSPVGSCPTRIRVPCTTSMASRAPWAKPAERT